MSTPLERSPAYWIKAAKRDFEMGVDWAGYLALLFWAESLPIYSCDDLGFCHGVSDKHDCVDCVKKRLTRYPLV